MKRDVFLKLFGSAALAGPALIGQLDKESEVKPVPDIHKSIEPALDIQESTEAELLELRQYAANNREANERLIELFKESPELVDIIRDMIDGRSFREAIMRNCSL